ncbi:MAG: hypothetical protein HYY09_06905 [Firmicutes bacterium]|nr:hypothetical protein [Bacillota bacterium]
MNRKLDAAVAEGLGLKVRWGPGMYYDERGWTNRADVPGPLPEGSQPFIYDPELEWILAPFFASDLDATRDLDVVMGQRGWKLSLRPLEGDPVDRESAGERPRVDRTSGRRPEEILEQGRFEELPDADGWIAVYELSDPAGDSDHSRNPGGAPAIASTIPQAVSLAAYKVLAGRDWVEIVGGE